MLDQDSSFYVINFKILITCLLNNVWYHREKVDVNHFWELKVKGLMKDSLMKYFLLSYTGRVSKAYV